MNLISYYPVIIAKYSYVCAKPLNCQIFLHQIFCMFDFLLLAIKTHGRVSAAKKAV